MNEYRLQLFLEMGVKIPERSLSYDNWRLVSCSPNLTEEFIREFKEELIWYEISAYQNLSIDFLNEFKNRIDWSVYFCLKEKDFQVMKKFITKAESLQFRNIETSHLNEQQKQELLKILKFKSLFNQI